jgi:hypothetical protein
LLSGGRSLLLHLAEAGRIDIERIHREEQLTRVKLGEIVVDAPRGLGKGASGLDRSMGSEGVSPGRNSAFSLAYLSRRTAHGWVVHIP